MARGSAADQEGQGGTNPAQGSRPPPAQSLAGAGWGVQGAGNQLVMLVPGCSRHVVPSKARRKPGPILLGAELQSKARAGLPNPDGVVMVPKEP